MGSRQIPGTLLINVQVCDTKKAPDRCPGLFSNTDRLLDACHVCGLKPFRTLCYFESHAITFSKGFEAITCDSGEVAEYILATFLLKKSKTLAVIEPFYCSVYHVLTSPDSSLFFIREIISNFIDHNSIRSTVSSY